MAAPARRQRALAFQLGLVSTVVWVVVSGLFAWRWLSIPRLAYPIKVAFPYGVLRVGLDTSNPPFASLQNGTPNGLEVDLAQALADQLGLGLQMLPLGYDGLYDALKTDQVDVLIATLRIDYSRSNEVRYTLPYYNAGLALVSSAGYDALPQISGLSLAYEYGSESDLFAQTWLRRIAPFQTMPYETAQIALDAARLGWAQAALTDATSARLYLSAHPTWQAQLALLTDTLYAAAVRLDRPAALERLNDALEILLENHTIAELLKKWL